MEEKMILNIDGYEDRRILAGILADNGYPVSIEDRQDPFVPTRHSFYVHVYEKEDCHDEP